MRLLVALNGPDGTESREVVVFANLDIAPLNLFKITFPTRDFIDSTGICRGDHAEPVA